MTKREAKNLAAKFAELRPRRAGDSEVQLWRDMIDATADHIPANIADAFRHAATNYGIWQKEYEGA